MGKGNGPYGLTKGYLVTRSTHTTNCKIGFFATAFGLLTALSLPVGTQADIYKTVDEHGNVVFTDNPKGKKAEKIELRKTNTQPPIKPAAPPSPKKSQPAGEPATRYQLSISTPSEGTHILPGQQTLAVSVDLTPALAEGHHLQATLNGQRFGPQTTGNSINLTNLYRGSHQLGVIVLGKRGEVLAQSQIVTVYVQRPSILRAKPK